MFKDNKSNEARHNLLLIYQQEKDWFKAIDIADDLHAKKSTTVGPMIAHFYCELAEVSRAKGDVSQLETYAHKALKYDVNCVRASILLADQAMLAGHDKQAIKLYVGIEKQDAESMMLVIDSLLECHTDLSTQGKL